jgi:hypothetical protein
MWYGRITGLTKITHKVVDGRNCAHLLIEHEQDRPLCQRSVSDTHTLPDAPIFIGACCDGLLRRRARRRAAGRQKRIKELRMTRIETWPWER